MNLNIQNSRLNIKFRVLHSDSISSSNDEHIARFIFEIWRIHTSLVCTSFGSFGGTVYIAISPGSIHVSVFSILLPLLVYMLICSFDTL